MNEKIRDVEENIQKNTEEMDEIASEINREKKIIRNRKQKLWKHHDLSLKPGALKQLRHWFKNSIEELKQTILEFEEKTESMGILLKDLRKKIKIFPVKTHLILQNMWKIRKKKFK